MRSALVIGLGRFGRHLATKFTSLGVEVLAVDINEDRINPIVDQVTGAQIGDCTNEQVLKSLGIRNFDLCAVCISGNFQASLEITALLKEKGAKFIISKADRDIHAKFLLRNGADEIVYPEREIAEKTAIRFSSDNVVDFLDISPEYSIFEIEPLKAWRGKTIKEVMVKTKYNINILAIKTIDKTKPEEQQVFVNPLPDAGHVFSASEILVVFGKMHDLEKLI